MAKATDVEVERRVSEVRDLLLRGKQRYEIVQYCAKYNLSLRAIDTYIKTATDQVKEHNKATFQENMAVITGALWRLHDECLMTGDKSEQRAILMSLAKLKGLDQQTINHVIEDKRDLEGEDPDELEAVVIEALGEGH
jgi:hypothetical protein